MTEPPREELLARIKLLEKQVKVGEKKVAKAEKRAAKAEEKAADAQRKQKAADQYAASVAKKVNEYVTVKRVALEALPVLAKLIEKINERLTDDPLWNELVFRQLKTLLGQLEPLRHGHSVLMRVVAKGNEKSHAENKKNIAAFETAIASETSKLIKSALHQVKNGVVINKVMQMALDKTKAEGTVSDLIDCIGSVVEAQLSQDAQKYFKEKENVTPSVGRQIVQRELPEVTVKGAEVPSDLVCPVCGGRKFHVIEQTPASKMIGTVEQFVRLIKVSVAEQTYAECANTGCATVLPIFKENAPMALNPKREITIDTLVAAADVMNSGMPLNRAEDVFFPELKTGSSTLSENLHQMGQYAKPLIEAIEAQAHRESVIIADETPFDILQAEGRGHQKQAEDGTEEETSSQTYMQAVTSTEGSETPFVLYYPMQGRSSERIAEVLRPFNAQCIMSDGYAAYGKIIRETKPETQHASCLVHWRREVLKAADFESQCTYIEQGSFKKAVGNYSERLSKSDPIPILNTVLMAVSKIFAEDKSVVRGDNETRDDYLKRLKVHREQYEKPYKEKIDLLMAELATMSKLKPAGRHFKVESADRTFYSDAVVYYFNHKEELWRFLENPKCPPSSNEVECTIRPLTIIRKNSYFLQSLEYARTFCVLMSLFETAQRNGINDPSKWLRTYFYRLAQHCQREQWIANTRPGCEKHKNPYTTFVKWEYEKYWHTMPIEDLLPWNYAKAQEPVADE